MVAKSWGPSNLTLPFPPLRATTALLAPHCSISYWKAKSYLAEQIVIILHGHIMDCGHGAGWVGGSHALRDYSGLREWQQTPPPPLSLPSSPPYGPREAHTGCAGASQGQEAAMSKGRNTGTGGSIAQDGSKVFRRSFSHSQPAHVLKKRKEREVAQSCPTLCDPTDCSLPGFSVHRIFWKELQEALFQEAGKGCSQDVGKESLLRGRIGGHLFCVANLYLEGTG